VLEADAKRSRQTPSALSGYSMGSGRRSRAGRKQQRSQQGISEYSGVQNGDRNAEKGPPMEVGQTANRLE